MGVVGRATRLRVGHSLGVEPGRDGGSGYPTAVNGFPLDEHDDRPRLPHIWAAQAARRELDFMGLSYAHALAARFIAASIAVGALAGLIVGGIREVWLWKTPSPKSTSTSKRPAHTAP